jgi:hypothetical protein
MLIGAKFRGISLGRLPAALFKLAAIAVAPGAAAMLIGPALAWLPIVGGLAEPLCTFVLQYTLLGLLFDLDESDTWYVMTILFILAIGLYLATRWFVPG